VYENVPKAATTEVEQQPLPFANRLREQLEHEVRELSMTTNEIERRLFGGDGRKADSPHPAPPRDDTLLGNLYGIRDHVNELGREIERLSALVQRIGEVEKVQVDTERYSGNGGTTAAPKAQYPGFPR
jgi:hypothetical protein